MLKQVLRFGVIALVIGAFFQIDARLIAQANAADPLIGNWEMDRSKSSFTGNAPEWRKMSFEKTPMGIKHTVDSMVGEVVQKLPALGRDSVGSFEHRRLADRLAGRA